MDDHSEFNLDSRTLWQDAILGVGTLIGSTSALLGLFWLTCWWVG